MEKDYIETTDTTYAAYLMLHDYTALGCVDSGKTNSRGFPSYDIMLTHSDEDIRERIHQHAYELFQKLQNEDRQFMEFWRHYKKLTSMTKNPLKVDRND